MKKCKIFLIVAMVLASMSVFSQSRPLEIGIPLGLGFYWGTPHFEVNRNGVGVGYDRAYHMALVNGGVGTKIPAFESYGLAARYLFTRRWAMQVQGMRQRMRFMEHDSRLAPEIGNYDSLYYYNAMWNVDVQAEYNFIKYGGANDVWTPYISAGVGISLHRKTAQYRWGVGQQAWTEDYTTSYPMIKDVGVACYVPFGAGVKWRVHLDWQLKFALQYQMYVLGNPAGGTVQPLRDVNGDPRKDYIVIENKELKYKDRVSYSDLPKGFGAGHNIVASICVIYTLGVERTVTTIF